MAMLPKVTQNYFDDIVIENMNDFGMQVEEAYLDALKQLAPYSSDLIYLATSPAKKDLESQISNLAKEFCSAISDFRSGKLKKLHLNNSVLIEVLELCRSSQFAAYVGAREGLIGAAIYLVTEGQYQDQNCCFSLLLAIMCCSKCRDVFPAEATEIFLSLSVSGSYPMYLDSVLKIIMSNERNKQLFFEKGLAKLLKFCLQEHSKSLEIVSRTCQLIRELVTDNDRREGIHPNTFIRGRELAEYLETTFLIPLINLIVESVTLELGEELLRTLFLTVQHLLVNDKACEIALKQGLVEVALRTLRYNLLLSNTVLNCLSALSKNDNAKLEIGSPQSDLLPAVISILFDSQESIEWVACLRLFSTIVLRQPDISKRLQASRVIERAIELMSLEAENPKILKEAMSLLRSMISSPETKYLVDLILNEGVEPNIRKACQDFPKTCKDPSYALLRELGLKYC